MVRKVIVGERMHKRAKTRLLDHRPAGWNCAGPEMHFILGDRMGADGSVDHRADKENCRVAPKRLAQPSGGRAICMGVVDMGVIGSVSVDHIFSRAAAMGLAP